MAYAPPCPMPSGNSGAGLDLWWRMDEDKAMRKHKGFTTLEMLLVLVILGIIGFVGWFVYQSKNDTDSLYNSAADTQIATKTTKKAAATATSASQETTNPVITAALKENTAAAISSGNTAALEGYMADSVNVVIAASEKTGAETAAQAVADLAYLDAGTDPWDFDLAAATLTTYKNGFYGQYFATDSTIVGQSANNYVVSFGVNASGKIDVVFMAVNADLLE